MSFAARPLLPATLPVEVLGAMALSRLVFDTPATAGITFNVNGSISYSNGSGITAWYTPLTTGIGNSHWVRFTLTSGSAWTADPTPGTLYVLSASRTLTWSANVGESKTAAVLVQIYTDAGGTQLIKQGTLTATVQADSLD